MAESSGTRAAVSPEGRRRIMQAIRGKDTGPERALRSALWRLGVRGWRCHWPAPGGRLDIAFPGRRIGVQVDGAFWHGHPSKWTPGRRPGYWDDKIAGNMARDRRQEAEMSAAGWTLIRLWEFEIDQDAESAARRVAEVVRDIDRRSIE